MTTRPNYEAAWAKGTEKGYAGLSRTAEDRTLLARQLAGILVDRYGARRVYLFGSVASGAHFHEFSDIDLAAEGLPPERYFEALAELWDMLPSGVELDLVPLEFASAEMLEVVRTEGIVLHAR